MPGTIRPAANRVVEDAGGGSLVLLRLRPSRRSELLRHDPAELLQRGEPCGGWRVPWCFSRPFPQAACGMIGVNSVQSAGKVRVRTSGSVKYPREDSIRRQSHRSKSMKISNSSEFSAKETKVKTPRVRACRRSHVRITQAATVFASV